MESAPKRGPRPLRVALLPALLLAAALAPSLAAAPDDVLVPDVRQQRLAEAQQTLEEAGLRLGEVWEVSWERILTLRGKRFPIGYVYMQAPQAGARWPASRPIHLAVSALQETRALPAGLLKKLAVPPAPPAPAPESAVPMESDPPRLPVPPPPSLPPRTVPEAGQPPAAEPGPAPVDAEPAAPPATPESADPRPRAEGSPDAPRPAPPPDPRTVPSILGLELAEAEQLVRDAEMTLYVERVPGHPVGRVLEQNPLPYAARPRGGVVKVVVTAGGDFEGATPPSPDVYVPDAAVPDLLDRTALQAGRILGDLGLLMQKEEGRRGLPGLVVDQMPAAGSKVPKGGFVRVWIAPPDPNAPKPPPPGPTPPPEVPAPESPEQPEAPPPETPPAPALPQPEAPQPLPPGPLPAGIPKPLSPGHGTELPKDDTVPVGFTWRGVKGAQVYVVEVEEEGAEGAWLPSMRKPSKKTAVLLDVERLGAGTSGRLRWRVRAVVGGREGKPSDWILLK